MSKYLPLVVVLALAAIAITMIRAQAEDRDRPRQPWYVPDLVWDYMHPDPAAEDRHDTPNETGDPDYPTDDDGGGWFDWLFGWGSADNGGGGDSG